MSQYRRLALGGNGRGWFIAAQTLIETLGSEDCSRLSSWLLGAEPPLLVGTNVNGLMMKFRRWIC